VAVLTFHSGEDRRVKKAFQAGLRNGVYASLSDGVITAGPDERRLNPRSSSAKLRWAVKSHRLDETISEELLKPPHGSGSR
jgi:16S rRNA (cytosine1402-N4)-methyltransferase